MVLSSTPYHHVEYYQPHNVIVSQWYGACSSEEYREALYTFLNFVRSNNVPYAISDRRMLPSISLEDLEWTLDEYLEDFCKLPLKRYAFINSFDPVAEKQIQQLIEREKQLPFPFKIKVFQDLTSAYRWVLEEDEV
ncbi:hypothetical protein POKO110462_12635 [Pontibacter korlensis]|uniref:STAS/SEC14 domain-containing protein n=1 Tax=Pontibacter korlensis TaxID=400092 RepID=A0A0E3UVI3_9BACT|nr:hypothetical protein [Pontibacter korlensis]AKD02552.1 hypothetical protein PKOR_04705 [Pontibacter korlensis]